jgi:hypothetical protein
MAKLRSNRQISVASVLLFLLAAFAIDPPEHRCRTQSTRNRPARTVRLDDHDGDHNRWHAYGFDNSGGDTQADTPDSAVLVVGFHLGPDNTAQWLIQVVASNRPSEKSRNLPRTRAPPPLQAIA